MWIEYSHMLNIEEVFPLVEKIKLCGLNICICLKIGGSVFMKLQNIY